MFLDLVGKPLSTLVVGSGSVKNNFKKLSEFFEANITSGSLNVPDLDRKDSWRRVH